MRLSLGMVKVRICSLNYRRRTCLLRIGFPSPNKLGRCTEKPIGRNTRRDGILSLIVRNNNRNNFCASWGVSSSANRDPILPLESTNNKGDICALEEIRAKFKI